MHAQVEAPTPKWYTCDFGCGFGGDLASVNEHENACGRNRASATAQSMGSARHAAAERPMHSGAPLKKHQRSVRQGYVRVVCVPARPRVPLSYAAATKLSFGLKAQAGPCLALLRRDSLRVRMLRVRSVNLARCVGCGRGYSDPRGQLVFNRREQSGCAGRCACSLFYAHSSPTQLMATPEVRG